MNFLLKNGQKTYRNPCQEKRQDNGKQKAESQIDCEQDSCFLKIKFSLSLNLFTPPYTVSVKADSDMADK